MSKRKLLKQTSKLRKQKKEKIKKFPKKFSQKTLNDFFNGQKYNKILFYQKLNYYLWNLCIFFALATLIFISLNELLWHFHLVRPIRSEAYLKTQFFGEVLGISVLLIELLVGFSKATNKALFIQQNWLTILAILPIGIFSKSLRAFEILGILEELYIFRGVQVVGKMTEFAKVFSSLLEQLPFASRIFLAIEKVFSLLVEFFSWAFRLFGFFK
ncbi:MAG: hypothetical protein ACK4J0_01500 [Candidatus Anstonellaceae archaeon]